MKTLHLSSRSICGAAFAASLICMLSTPASGFVQSFSDDFEPSNINRDFWSIHEENGTVRLSTEASHSGVQSARFASSSGGQRYIQLFHTFASPVKGSFPIWFYDNAPGQETLYEQLQLTNSAQPGLAAGIGTMDFDAFCYMAVLALPSGTNVGPNASCGIFPQISTTNVRRTLGWHRLEINASVRRILFSIDEAEVFSAAGDFDFDTVTINVSGPSWRPNTVAWFDDFTFSPLQPPIIASLTASPALLWPPNHKMVPVSLAVEASDGTGVTPACSVTRVTSNELPTAPGEVDWATVGPLRLALRSERAGTGRGRSYVMTVTCTNASSLSTSQTVAVAVPHDRRDR